MCLWACVYCVIGGLGLSLMDEIIITEEISYGCTGIGTAVVANGLAVSHMHTALSNRVTVCCLSVSSGCSGAFGRVTRGEEEVSWKVD